MTFKIWEGVHKDFKDVPVVDKGFDGEKWIQSQRKTVLEAMARLGGERAISGVVGYADGLLPFLAALVCTELSKVRILDLGGGVGLTYVQVLAALVDRGSVEYHIVEKEGICEAGRAVFKGDDRIRFHSSLPDGLEVDVVHIGSALQYVEDWKGLLRGLASYRSRHLLFTHLPAGELETFATAQNYYGSKIPCWIFDIDEVVSVLVDEGFDLSFKSAFYGKYMNQGQEQFWKTFPAGKRLETSCNLLFSRVGSSQEGD